ncbi:MAG: hypothetical protein AB7I04_11360 [Pseudomonadales bacterium]
MTDINVDDFFKDAARALVVLYGVFPRRHTLFVEDIYALEEPDEFGLHSERYQACFGTLVWLGEENYLRFTETIRSEAVDQAILTGRAFTLLSSPAGVIEEAASADLPELVRVEHSTHIHRIKSALKNRSSIELRRAMLGFMAGMERLAAPAAQP